MIVKEAREMRRHGKTELIADRREALRSVGDGRNRLFQPRVMPLLDLKRVVPGIQDPGFHLGQRHSGETHLARGGLSVNEGAAERRGEHPLGMGRGVSMK